MSFRKTIRRFALVIAIVAMLPTFYILSIGPVIFCYERFGFPAALVSCVETTYQPLRALFESRSIGGKAFRAYIRLWSKEKIPDDLDIAVPSGM